MNPINKQLFENIEKRFRDDNYNNIGTSHPVNILLNYQDDLIEAYSIYASIKDKKDKLQRELAKLDSLITKETRGNA